MWTTTALGSNWGPLVLIEKPRFVFFFFWNSALRSGFHHSWQCFVVGHFEQSVGPCKCGVEGALSPKIFREVSWLDYEHGIKFEPSRSLRG